MRKPEEFDDGTCQVLQSRWSLYGLKQYPCAWYQRIDVRTNSCTTSAIMLSMCGAWDNIHVNCSYTLSTCCLLSTM